MLFETVRRITQKSVRVQSLFLIFSQNCSPMGIIDIGTLGQQRTGITGINYVKNMLGWDYPCHIIPKGYLSIPMITACICRYSFISRLAPVILSRAVIAILRRSVADAITGQNTANMITRLNIQILSRLTAFLSMKDLKKFALPISNINTT